MLAAAVTGLEAQQVHVVQGRVLERGSGVPIARATVEIENVGSVVTSADGRFRFESVPAGYRLLTTQALGYLRERTSFMLTRDTAWTIELEVAPIVLDTISIKNRRVRLRGEVTDITSGDAIIDADVEVTPDTRRKTDMLGRFQADLPASIPARVSVTAFGYLPFSITAAMERDTLVRIRLEPDPVALRMIHAQVERLRTRSHGVRDPLAVPIDRAELLFNRNATLADLLFRRFGARMAVRCLLIDDVLTYFGPGGQLQGMLSTMMPHDFERIELLMRGRMLRLYTREYIRRMVGGQVELKPPLYVEASPPFCR